MKARHVQFNLISFCSCLCLLSVIAFADSTIPSVDNVFRMSLAGAAAEDAPVQAPEGSSGDATGTDPRDFSNKFMPYYLYTELDNGVKVNQFNLFGMVAFTSDLAMTFDWSVYKDVNYSSVVDSGFPGSDSESGYGDLGLRFFYKRPEWGGKVGNQGETWSLMGGFEVTLPTASDDLVLGGDTTILSPMLVIVTDIPGEPPFGLGFLAFMNFFDFDVDQGKYGSDVTRYRGRWFWMQPLSKPGPALTDGLYMLTELQPVYDFETDEFDLWMGPEFGKIIRDGHVGYIKPGWGFSPDPTDRKFTLEVGYRYFF